MGSTSAVMIMNSQIPRLRVLVASLALRGVSCRVQRHDDQRLETQGSRELEV